MTGAGGRWRAGLKPGIVDEASFPDCIAERFPTNAFFLTRFSHLYLPVFPSLPPCLPPPPSPTQPHCLDFLLPFGPGLNFSSLSLSLSLFDLWMGRGVGVAHAPAPSLGRCIFARLVLYYSSINGTASAAASFFIQRPFALIHRRTYPTA